MFCFSSSDRALFASRYCVRARFAVAELLLPGASARSSSHPSILSVFWQPQVDVLLRVLLGERVGRQRGELRIAVPVEDRHEPCRRARARSSTPPRNALISPASCAHLRPAPGGGAAGFAGFEIRLRTQALAAARAWRTSEIGSRGRRRRRR